MKAASARTTAFPQPIFFQPSRGAGPCRTLVHWIDWIPSAFALMRRPCRPGKGAFAAEDGTREPMSNTPFMGLASSRFSRKGEMALSVDNVGKDYPTHSGTLSVLADVSFSLADGEALA